MHKNYYMKNKVQEILARN